MFCILLQSFSCFFGLNLFSLAISLVLTLSHDFQNPRPSHDAKMLGEMIFGSVAMTYKGQTVKVHEIRYALFHKAWWQACLASACLNWLCSLYWQALNFILLCFFMCICIKSASPWLLLFLWFFKFYLTFLAIDTLYTLYVLYVGCVSKSFGVEQKICLHCRADFVRCL